MSDLDTRLQAARDRMHLDCEPAPDLAAALRTVRSERPSRRVPLVIAACIAAALVATATGIVATWFADRGSTPAATGYGRTLVPKVLGATVSAVDARTLDVGVELIDPQVPCAFDNAVARVIGQDAGTVTVSVSPYTTRPRPVHATDADDSCAIERFETVPLRLAAPLGHRQLLDTAGRVLPVVREADLPAVTYLPTGYKADFRSTDPLVYRRGPSGDRTVYAPGYTDQYAGNGELQLPVASRVFSDELDGVSSIELAMGTSSALVNQPASPMPKVVGHVMISGHRAAVSEPDHERCLTWTSATHRALQLCSAVGWDGHTGRNDEPLLSVGELAKIARNLH